MDFEKGEYLHLEISYFTGWPKKRTEIKEEFIVEVISDLENRNDKKGINVKFSKCVFFSWGNGPTLGQNTFVLFEDNTLGYIYKTDAMKWTEPIPKWKLIKKIHYMDIYC